MMDENKGFDETVSKWLEEAAPARLPERVLDATFERTRKSPQHAGWRGLLQRLHVSEFTLAASATAAIVVVASLAAGLFVNGSGFGGDPSPTATAAPTSTPEATVVVRQPDDRGPGITVTIPASGWNFDRRFGALAKGVDVADVPEATILHWAFPPGTRFYVWGDPCRAQSTRPGTPATTVDAFAAALAAQASRDASEPVDVTIGGYAGKSLTLHVPDDAVFADCESEGSFATYGTDADPGARTQQGPGQIDELWILDVDGSIVVIDAMYRADTPAELLEEMRSIARSANFDSPSGEGRVPHAMKLIGGKK